MATTDSAVAAALLEAAMVVQKLQRQFGMNVAENGKRAVAGVLYQQKHGGNFPSVQAVFQVDGKNTFSKPSFNHYRDAMADLDDPTAVVRRMELEAAARQRNAASKAAARGGGGGKAQTPRRVPAAARTTPAGTLPQASSQAPGAGAPSSTSAPTPAPAPHVEPIADELGLGPLQPCPDDAALAGTQPPSPPAPPPTPPPPAPLPPSPPSPPSPPPPMPPPLPRPPSAAKPGRKREPAPFVMPGDARIDLSARHFWHREAMLHPSYDTPRRQKLADPADCTTVATLEPLPDVVAKPSPSLSTLAVEMLQASPRPCCPRKLQELN